MKQSAKSGSKAPNYRKPPREHQFKKGKSGNPNGRPKKNVGASPSGSVGPIYDRLHAIVLDEGHRTIAVKEGEKLIEVPAMQAVMRNMMRLAAQGDAKIARQVLDLHMQAEAARAEQAREILKAALEHQQKWTPVFDLCAREKREPPDIYPHPDDLIINPLTGEVTIDGPSSREEAGARKILLERATETFLRFFELERELKENPGAALQKEYAQLKAYQDIAFEENDRKLRHRAIRESRVAALDDSSGKKGAQRWDFDEED